MSKYTRQVREVFQQMKRPYPGFIVDLVEYPSHLALRVYFDNVESFSEPQKLVIAEWLYQLADTINALGVKCDIEGVTNSPPNRKSIPHG